MYTYFMYIYYTPASFTIINEYPCHKLSHCGGHSGIDVVWLWTAMTMDGASHTVHLRIKDQLLVSLLHKPSSGKTGS